MSRKNVTWHLYHMLSLGTIIRVIRSFILIIGDMACELYDMYDIPYPRCLGS